jgi:hypothetical protein
MIIAVGGRLNEETGMSAKSLQCTICKSPLAVASLEEISGEEGSLAVKVRGMPVLQCAHGHRQFANGDFPLLLLDRLVEQDEPQLPASDTKGMLFKEYHCSACGEKLEHDPAQRHTFHVRVEMQEFSPFDVDLTLPVHRCTKCGREQLHSLKELKGRTPAALAHAFKAAHIAAH